MVSQLLIRFEIDVRVLSIDVEVSLPLHTSAKSGQRRSDLGESLTFIDLMFVTYTISSALAIGSEPIPDVRPSHTANYSSIHQLLDRAVPNSLRHDPAQRTGLPSWIPPTSPSTPSPAFLSSQSSPSVPTISRLPKQRSSLRRSSAPLSRAAEHLKAKQKEELRAAAKALG